MDCAELDALLSEHTLAELTPEQRAAVAAHSAACDACRQKWGLDAQSQAFHDGAKALGPQRSLKDAVLAKLGAEPPQPGAPPAENGHPKLKRLGGFELLGRIGKGGMGTVLKARQVILDRLVALKVLPKKLAQNEAYVQRFLREARSAAQLSHPNIVQAIDAGFAEGYYYFAMEFVDGETLDAIRGREGPMDPRRALQLLKQVTSALAAAHDAGIVHRDIKPSNIMIDRNGEARVADFGLAKRVEGDISITATGVALGTPMYLSPEMATGKEVDGRADLYSLGATFFHLLAGRPPFEGQASTELIVKHVTEPAPSLASVAPSVDPRLCRIIDRLLLKQPADRYPSAHVLLADLDALAALRSPPFPAEAGPGAEMLRVQATRELPAAPEAARRRPTAHRPPPAMPGGQPRPRPRRGLSLSRFAAGAAVGLAALFVIILVAALVRTPARTGSDTPPRPGPTPEPTQEAPQALKDAQAYEAQNPNDLSGALARYERLVADYPGTEAARLAGERALAIRGAMALAQAIERLRVEAEARMRTDEFGKALALVAAFAKEHPSGKGAAEATKMTAAVLARAESRFLELARAAEAAAQAEDFARAREALRPVLETFGIEALRQRAQSRLGEFDRAEAALAQAIERLRAEIGVKMKAEEFGKALALTDAFATQHPLGKGTAEAAKMAGAVRAAAETRYLELDRAADAAAQAKDFARAQEALRPVIETFGIEALRQRAQSKIDEYARLGGNQGKEGWISLFDGKTLGQWKPVGDRGFQAQAPTYVQDGCIVLEPGRPLTGVRWEGDFPRMNYEVTLEAQRIAGKDGFCNVYFPYGATHSMISVGSWGGSTVGILLVDGVDVHLNSTRRHVEFQQAEWYALKLRVTSGRIQFWIGPACVVDFDTRGHVLGPDDFNRWARLAPFGLASFETKGAIRNIRLRHLTQVPE